MGKIPFSYSLLRQAIGALRVAATSLTVVYAATCSAAVDHIDPMASAEGRISDALRMDGVPGGVVLNKTLTMVGFDFYQYFAKAWRTLPNTDRYSIVIVERPNAMRGSEIWIEHRNKRIFSTHVSPRRSAVKNVSHRAVGLVHQAVIDAEVQQVLYHDPDLAQEELQ